MAHPAPVRPTGPSIVTVRRLTVAVNAALCCFVLLILAGKAIGLHLGWADEIALVALVVTVAVAAASRVDRSDHRA